MISDEALIEKMAEAMWNANVDVTIHGTWADEKGPNDEFGMGSAHEFYTMARAALSVVRENEKKGLVQAASTGAVLADKCNCPTGMRYHAMNCPDYPGAERNSTISRPMSQDEVAAVEKWAAGTPLALPRKGAAQAKTVKGFKIVSIDGDSLADMNDGSAAAARDGEPCIVNADWLNALICEVQNWRAKFPGLVFYGGPNQIVDRSAPAAPREPNLPLSLLSRLDHQGGLTKGKRS